MSNEYKDWVRDIIWDKAIERFPLLKVRHIAINYTKFCGIVGGEMDGKYVAFTVYYFDD